jgi:DNA modification methylase
MPPLDSQQTQRGSYSDTDVVAQAFGENYALYCGDCIEVMRGLPNESVGFGIFSPPFASLYTYSASERDLGNVKSDAEFHKHFAFVIAELYRVLMPGRLVSFHCMDMPSMKSRDGMIGLKDFPAILIQAFQAAGFIYHSRVVIWKDPLIEATRTKALGLMHKQILKDSSMCRQGLPDYLITMRKPGDNAEPIQHPDGFTTFIGLDEPKAPRKPPTIRSRDIERYEGVTSDDPVYSHQVWRRYASPVWMDIDQTRTLQRESAREEKDERHICPLQLDVIERALELWSNPGDTVLSPFAGIGSEGFVAVSRNRRFIGIELKASYWKQAAANLALAEAERDHDLFTTAPEARQTAIPA